jgi:hypothetical protein
MVRRATGRARFLANYVRMNKNGKATAKTTRHLTDGELQLVRVYEVGR